MGQYMEIQDSKAGPGEGEGEGGGQQSVLGQLELFCGENSKLRI